MKKILLFLLSISLLIIPSWVLADGFVVNNFDELIYLPAQKAVISWDGGKERMILSTKISTGNITEIAWIVPVPSSKKPEVNSADIEIFYHLSDLFWDERSDKGSFLEFGAAEMAVEVVDFKKIDIYDIAILKADSAQALTDWLNQNDYSVTDEITPILQDYVSQGDFYFIANKINLENQYPDLTISEADQACFNAANSEVQDYIEHSYQVYNFAHIGWIFDEVEECGDSVIDPLAVEVLFELGQGISTPLQIDFYPSHPFYPMQISSLNPGEAIVDVYIFSDTPMSDSSDLLQINQMTKNPGWLGLEEAGFEENYITFLSYIGDLQDLDKDSWFEPADYNKYIDPQNTDLWYIGLGERETWEYILSDIYYFSINSVLPFVVIIFAIIGFVATIIKVINLIKKKYKK